MLFVILSLAYELLSPSAGKAQVAEDRLPGRRAGQAGLAIPNARAYPLRRPRNTPVQNLAQAGHPFSGGDDPLRFARR